MRSSDKNWTSFPVIQLVGQNKRAAGPRGADPRRFVFPISTRMRLTRPGPPCSLLLLSSFTHPSPSPFTPIHPGSPVLSAPLCLHSPVLLSVLFPLSSTPTLPLPSIHQVFSLNSFFITFTTLRPPHPSHSSASFLYSASLSSLFIFLIHYFYCTPFHPSISYLSLQSPSPSICLTFS